MISAVLVLAASLGQAAPPAERPRLQAVLIAIDEYADKGIAPCPGAVGDAQALRRWLIDRERGGWTGADVLVMDRQSQRTHGAATEALPNLYPSHENLDWVLTEWLPAHLGPNDIALIAFAGQAAGFPPRADAPPGSPGRHYLLPIDAKAANLDGTGWPIEDALDRLAAPGRNPVLLWLDTSLAGRGRPAVAGLEPVDSASWLATLTRWPSVSAWLAADGEPSADRGRERSPFTKAVLDHLGSPDEPRNLLGLLGRLNREPALREQGFRTAGGVPANLTLWSRALPAVGRRPPELVLQNGHGNRVWDVAVSPDGTTVYTAGADSTVKVWRREDRTLLRTLARHTIGVTHLALSPGGQRLATADGAGRVWFWGLPEFSPLISRVPRPHQGEVVALEFVDDGSHAVSLASDGKALLWEVAQGEAKPTPLAERVQALAAGSGRIAAAVRDEQGNSGVRLFDRAGRPAGDLPGPGGGVTPRLIALDGGRLAVADAEGRVVVWDLAAGKERRRFQVSAPVSTLRFAGETLAVGAGDRLLLYDLGGDGVAREADAGGGIDRLIGSPDGRMVATADEIGNLRVWDIAHPERPRLRPGGDAAPIVTAIAFDPGARFLVSGGQAGDWRLWDLPSGLQSGLVPARRAQLGTIAVSRDGRSLVQLTLGGQAAVWDLAAGRTLGVIAGRWTAAAFVPDRDVLAMTDDRGDVALVEPAGGRRRERAFERPMTVDGRARSAAAFRRVAVSPDGRLVAAGAAEANLACVWDIETGRLVRTIRQHPDGVVAVAFSPDGRYLLTAGREGAAAWDARQEGAPSFRVGSPESPITAAALVPGAPARLLTGHADGQVIRWAAVPDGRPRPAMLERLDGAVQALAVTPDGNWVAAGGDDKVLRLIPLDEARPGPPVPLNPAHEERITSIVAWADAPVIASAGEDAAIRLWRLTDRTLLGTLTAVPETGDWVAFTPQGQFDSSPGAERRVAWRVGGAIMPLDQLYEGYRAFRLTDSLRRGTQPEIAFAYTFDVPPPALAIDRPPPTSARREVELSVTLGDDQLDELRLYLNGVPVREGGDFVRRDPFHRRRYLVKATLRKGTNRLYVMGRRAVEGAVSGRSNTVEIVSEAPDRAGRLHVLALGVDSYPNRPLRFSAADAQAFGEHVHGHPAEEAPAAAGLLKVLRNGEVTLERVAGALSEIRAESRPEDTVVVFLAGHTGVRRGPGDRDQFCLLLPSFPFPEPRPGEVVAMLRDAPVPGDKPDPPKSVLPYAEIVKYLIRMDALQRVVVIDACQAAAAADDPRARRLEKNAAEKVDDAAQRARTTYLLASRRNDPAFEVEDLGHGLLTHLLLRGMGAANLRPDPGSPLPPADADTDGIVTTAELSRYVDEHLPALASRVTPVALREAPERRGDPVPPRPPYQAQAAPEAAFPLVRLPVPATAPAR